MTRPLRVLALLCVVAPSLHAADDRGLFPFSPRAQPEKAAGVMPPIPIQALQPDLRDKVQSVLDRPALTSRGLAETFQAEGHVYRWLLDHPDMTVKLWKQLGAKVTDITQRPDGLYVWQDENGSEVTWQSAHRAAGMHLWYAEGKVKAGALLPMTNFRAVMVMSIQEGKDTTGKDAVRHQVHFLLRCDSKAVTLAAKILGASAPRMAEQYLGQLQMFYGGMAWYLGQDAERAKRMYKQIGLILPDANNR